MRLIDAPLADGAPTSECEAGVLSAAGPGAERERPAGQAPENLFYPADMRVEGGLRILLERAGLSPEAFARQLNTLARELGIPRQMSEKNPYKWFRGSVPREPWPALTA